MSNFRKAMQTTLIFALIFVVLHIGIFQCLFHTEHLPYQDCYEREQLQGSLEYIILGSSHATWGVDTAVVDETLGVNSYNLGNEWISFKSRYFLLEYEMNRNPVDTVLLEVSYDSIRDVNILGRQYMLSRLNGETRGRYFFNEFTPAEYKEAYEFCFFNGMDALKMRLKGEAGQENRNPNVHKGYVKYESVDVSAEDYSAIYNTEPLYYNILDENVEYLQKIVDLCKEKDVELILVTIPFSKTLICKSQNLDQYKEWYEDYAQENDLLYLDFNLLRDRDSRYPDETCFINEEHIGGEAAAPFTAQMLDILKRAKQGEDVTGEFFDSYEDYELTQDYIH